MTGGSGGSSQPWVRTTAGAVQSNLWQGTTSLWDAAAATAAATAVATAVHRHPAQHHKQLHSGPRIYGSLSGEKCVAIFFSPTFTEDERDKRSSISPHSFESLCSLLLLLVSSSSLHTHTHTGGVPWWMRPITIPRLLRNWAALAASPVIRLGFPHIAKTSGVLKQTGLSGPAQFPSDVREDVRAAPSRLPIGGYRQNQRLLPAAAAAKTPITAFPSLCVIIIIIIIMMTTHVSRGPTLTILIKKLSQCLKSGMFRESKDCQNAKWVF